MATMVITKLNRQFYSPAAYIQQSFRSSDCFCVSAILTVVFPCFRESHLSLWRLLWNHVFDLWWLLFDWCLNIFFYQSLYQEISQKLQTFPPLANTIWEIFFCQWEHSLIWLPQPQICKAFWEMSYRWQFNWDLAWTPHSILSSKQDLDNNKRWMCEHGGKRTKRGEPGLS